MKTIKEGKLPPTTKKASCAACGAVVEIEPRDKPVRISKAKAHPGPKYKCPTKGCKGELSLQK
jgi:hypothetical protein